MRFIPCCRFVLLVLFAGGAAAAAEPDYDVLIQHGRVFDGTGQAGVPADVAIRDGRIAAVGNLSGKTAKDTIDASGRVVCPGFIDLHNHGDGGILKFRGAENFIRQGVTTLVCGNCGSSPVDVAEFFARLRDGGTGPNIALLIGHGSVRRTVLGSLNVPPNETQLAEMRRLVRQAMQDGAVGMSTGLVYSPGAYAATEELIELAKELKPYGGFYATHMRDEGTRILEALEEALRIGREAGVPVHVSHHKISSASVFGLTRQTLARIDRARSANNDVTLDQYPYAAGSGGLSFYVPQSSLSGGIDAYRRRIADPQQRAEIVAAVELVLIAKTFEVGQTPDRPGDTAAALSRIQIARAAFDTALEGQTVTQILRSRQQEPTVRNGAELLVELVGREVGGINHTLDGEPGGDVDRVLQHSLTSIASDGSVLEFDSGHPHPRCYGCYPRVLGHYVRERKLLSLEEAIHKMTDLPARRLGWTDRGIIRPGASADIVVFDPQTIADRATFTEPHQHSVGVDHVLVNGRFVLKAGKMTGEQPGRPIERATAVAALLPPAAKTAVATDPSSPYPPVAEVKAAFLKQLDRPRIPLDAQTRKTETDAEGFVAENISIASECKADSSVERVPLLVVRPGKPAGKLPAVIVLHGTGGNKESQRGVLIDLARRGIVGVAIDARYHGERSGGAKGADAYIAAITRAWKTPAGQPQEHPFYFDTCWDLWRVIDYLQTRSDVDGNRLGMIGFSMGGIQTWLAASVDDRIKVAVPAISVQSFRWSLDNGAWQGRARTIQAAHLAAAADLGEPEINARVCLELWNKVIPGMLGQFDCPSMLRLFAGRPLLIANGELDPNCPIGGARVAFAYAEAAYAAAGAKEKLKILVAPETAHKVTDDQRQAALDWLAKWLAD